ncbi:Cullin repeat-like-containing domain protein, partial [Jimgerdemannia flammicorona]
MCTANPKPFTEQLFTGIADYLEEYTSDIRQSILEHDDIVTAYARAFEKYFLAADCASKICDYLNRLLLKSKESNVAPADKRQIVGEGRYRRQTIQAVCTYIQYHDVDIVCVVADSRNPLAEWHSSLAMLIWRDRVVHHIRNSDLNRLLYQVFEFIRRDRDGEDIRSDVVSAVVGSLGRFYIFSIVLCVHWFYGLYCLNSLTDQPLQLYIEEFERPYLIHTKRYYQREAARVVADASISEYMTQATHRLAQEVARNHRYCHLTSHMP